LSVRRRAVAGEGDQPERQADVDDGDVGPELLGKLQRRRAVERGACLVSVGVEQLAEEYRGILVVVDNEDAPASRALAK
jgi:hypothetical protein